MLSADNSQERDCVCAQPLSGSGHKREAQGKGKQRDILGEGKRNDPWKWIGEDGESGVIPASRKA